MRCARVEHGARALRARDVAWRHAGSTRNEVGSEVQAVAAYLLLDEKRGDAPLLVPNQRGHEGVVKLTSSPMSSAMRAASS